MRIGLTALTRLIDGGHKGNQNSVAGRVVAEWEATPTVSLRLAADYTKTREEGLATTLLQVNEGAVFPVFNNIFKNAPACLPPSPLGNANCYNAGWLTPTFNPEFARVFEVGLKTILFNRRLRLNAAVFDTKYNDLQIIVADGFAPKVRNAGRARIRGAELEAQLAASNWAHFTGSFSYLDARYLSIDPRAAPVTIDSKLANTPQVTASAGINLEAYRGPLGRAVIQGDWSYRSSTYKDAINTRALRQAPYSVFNTSVGFYSKNEWSIMAGVLNLTDTRTIVSGYSDLNFIGATYAVFSRPREWYLKLGYKF